ncbi:MAG TPA: response regulator [Chitinophagaceae bacterium]|nr:response regulator [Chitinophagaceae bacterium]
MKKIYILLLAFPLLVLALSYLPVWWAAGAVLALMVFIAYRFYSVRLHAAHERNSILENEVEELHIRLEQAVSRTDKANEAADQTRQSKQQLLSIINHEVRTPMNGILGTALLLSDTGLTAEQEEHIKTIRGCGESLLTTVNSILVNDILEFSKLQHENGELEYKDFNLRDAVEELLELLAGKARQANLDLVYHIEEGVPEQLIGDSRRFRQVLMNLLENAVKFTYSGEVYIGISCTKHSTGNWPELHVEVSDTGAGIPAEQLARLFKGMPGKEYTQDNNLPGLGLVVCKRLVDMMGGRIEATSKEWGGSCFTFSIPVTPSPRLIRDHAQKDNMAKLHEKHVLVVDDNATARTALVKQLSAWNMLPVGVASGSEALQAISGKSFDLVITDIDMPGMNGLQLANAIAQQYPAIPIIAMNNAAPEKFQEKTGVYSSIISKPLRQYALREHILAALSKTGQAKDSSAETFSNEFSQRFPLRILVAEDNLINQKIALKILSRLGYEAVLANNGKEAIEAAGQEPFDIILMDVEMPEMNGLDATKMIRTCLEIQPVIIALTANTLQGDRDACMQAGMDDYMSKPIEMTALLSQLEKWALVIRERKKLSA